jgi:outer membrane protein OmpA-like peptidoglycan-associated protein
MKKIFFFFLLVSVQQLAAQFVVDYLKAADDYFLKQDYASAVAYYEKYLDATREGATGEYNPYAPQRNGQKAATQVTDDNTVAYRMAESYRQLNFPSKAAPLYKQVLARAAKKFPVTGYYYAQQLRSLGQYEEAHKQFTAFLATYKPNDEIRKGAVRELENLNFVQAEMKKKGLQYYSLKKAPKNLNSAGASYAPVWLEGNKLLFTSTRPLDSTARHPEYVNRLYTTNYVGGQVSALALFALSAEKGMQQGVAALSPDGNTLYLTQWSLQGGKKQAAIYSSLKTKEGWSTPVLLDEAVNTPGANNQQPFVTPDGKYLFFCSDRKGGEGGFDLWYAPLMNGKVGKAVNFGKYINTAGDEQAPFYHAASASLVFSSNGRVGMGGYDFYQSSGNLGNWSVPVNLGYPVNSVKDDIYFVSRGSAKNILEDVVLSSDREAACCLELFSLRKEIPRRTVKGSVISCVDKQPIEGVTIRFFDASGKEELRTQETDRSGQYAITLEEFSVLKVIATRTGFADTLQLTGIPSDPWELVQTEAPLCMNPVFPPAGTVEEIADIFYEFDKATLKEESFPSLDKLAARLLANPNVVLEIRGHTDNKGKATYNQRLSEARAKSCVEYLVGKGVRAAQLQSRGYGATLPVAPNQNSDGSDNPEGRARNRRTEFKVLSTGNE